MTEHEWLTSTDGNRVINLLRTGSDRKLRLVACALCRTLWVRLSSSAREAVELGEEFADGMVEMQEREKMFDRLGAAGSYDPNRVGKWLPMCAISECGWYAAELSVGSNELSDGVEVAIIRDIFGNPFRPVTIDPRWQTETVVALAAGIYEARAFERMPILADALQEAGCDNEQVLQHCREPGQHVRGCWVVDLLLGKQ